MADADCKRRKQQETSIKIARTLLSRFFVPACMLFFFNGSVAQGQGAWQQIRQRGSLTIATDDTYPPFEFEVKGRLVGFDRELGDEIGKQLGVGVKWLPLEWTAVQGSLESRKADLIMSGMTITAERKQKGYTFSRPYFLSGQAMARRRTDTQINTVQDLRDKTVSVQDQTTGMTALQKAGLPDTQIVKFDTLPDGLTNVHNGKTAACVADVPALTYNLSKSYPDLEMVGASSFAPEYLGIAAARGETELAARINHALDILLVNGAYARIYQKWIGQPLTAGLVGQLDKVRDEGSAIPADVTARVEKEGARWGRRRKRFRRGRCKCCPQCKRRLQRLFDSVESAA